MEYKYTNDKKSIAKQDVHIIGVFSDKKLNHVESVISKESLIDIKRIIKTCNFAGKVGDHRTVDDFQTKKQIVLFGLGEKKKIWSLIN